MQRNSFWNVYRDQHIGIRIAFWITVMLLLTVAAGCKSGGGDIPRASGELPTRLAVISENAERIKPHADSYGKELATVIADDAKKSIVNAKTITDGYQRATDDYRKLRGDPWVSAAIWLKRLVYTLVITWFVLGIASVFLGVGNPLGWTWKIGTSIRRFLPFANPFGWLNDLLRKRTASTTSTLKPKRK